MSCNTPPQAEAKWPDLHWPLRRQIITLFRRSGLAFRSFIARLILNLAACPRFLEALFADAVQGLVANRLHRQRSSLFGGHGYGFGASDDTDCHNASGWCDEGLARGQGRDLLERCRRHRSRVECTIPALIFDADDNASSIFYVPYRTKLAPPEKILISGYNVPVDKEGLTAEMMASSE